MSQGAGRSSDVKKVRHFKPDVFDLLMRRCKMSDNCMQGSGKKFPACDDFYDARIPVGLFGAVQMVVKNHMVRC